MKGLPPEIMLIHLPGHTKGHCGVAIQTSNGWILHAGDSYFHHGQIQENPNIPAVISLFQRLVHMEYKKASETKDRLRQLHLSHRDEITILCGHDTEELEAFSS